MTHSLHRIGTIKNLRNDYCLLCLPEKNINLDGAEELVAVFLDIVEKNFPSNYGVMTCGNMYTCSKEDMLNDLSKCPAVFSTHENPRDVENILDEVKKHDLGISIVVTGLYDQVKTVCEAVGLKPHTTNHSLGIWGKQELIPPTEILEFTSMCGHSLVSRNLVEKLVAEVAAGKRNSLDAAIEMAKPCLCGFFNTSRAQKLIDGNTS